MDLSLSISNRQISPAVVNMFQLENNSSTLTFKLDSYKHDQIDLRNYKAYAVTSINGQIDMTELESAQDGSGLILTWQLQDYSLRQFGAIQYQIVFKENTSSGENTAVFYSYKGIIIVRASINADDHITANYPTLLKQWIDRINELAGTFDAAIVYMQPNQALDISERLAGRIYYQIENTTTGEGHFQDHTGKRIGEFNAKYVANADLNTMLTHGEYICGGTLTNMPLASTYCMVRVTDSGSTNRVIQEVYVPNADGELRVFMRATKSDGSTFGNWDELISKKYVDAMVGDKDFEIKCLTAFHTNDLTDLYIDTFEDTSALTSIPDGYDSRLHQFHITSDCTLVFKGVAISGKSHLWYDIDFETDSMYEPYIEYSFDSGKTWEYMSTASSDFGQIANLTQKPSIMIRVQLSSSTTLKAVAFGLK